MSAIDEARSRYRNDGEELDPILTGSADDPDDFSGITSDQVMKVFDIGAKRKEQLDHVVRQSHDGSYRIPNAHKSQYADFCDQANHAYLTDKYKWLHHTTDYVGIDEDEATESHGSLESYMASVPHEDWQAFITDLMGLEDYHCLDDDKASELEIEEQGRWMTEDGGPDLIKAMVESRDDTYEGYLLSKVTPEMIWEWARDTDHYPEGDGQGGVYMDMEKYGEDSETQDYFLELLDDDVAGWVAIKRDAYEAVINDSASGLVFATAADAFDYMLRQMAAEHEEVSYVYNQIDAPVLWEMFLQAFPDERRHDGDPYWYLWRESYDQPKIWKMGFDSEMSRHWSRGYGEALDYLRHAEWFIKMIGSWKNRPPEGQQELPFESLVREALEAEPNPDDAETFVRHGGGLREEVIYEDDNIVVMYPRDVQTLNHHLRRLGYPEVTENTWTGHWKGNDKDIFVVLGKDGNDLLGREGKKEIGVLVGDYKQVRGYNGNYTNDALKALLTHPQYGKSVRRMLLRYYRDQAKANSFYAPVLLALGGAKELRRLARYGDFDLSAYSVSLGLHYVERKKYVLAAKAFNRPIETMDPSGVWLIYDDVSSLIGVFKNEEGAQAVFDGETHDWFSHYYDSQNLPEVDDVMKFAPPDVIKHLREVMTNRRVWFPDGGPDGQGEYVLLTPKLMAGYDDDTIISWLTNPSEQDTEDGVFDDIFDEIKLAGADILSAASNDEVQKGYTKAAVNAIDGIHHRWTKAGFEVYVRWRDVQTWADAYQDDTGTPYDGSLEDLALHQNRDSVDPDVSNMEAGWRDVDKESAAQNFDRVYQLDTRDAEPLPDDRRQLQMPFTESEDPDAPEAMAKLLSGVPVEFEQQVAAILKDFSVKSGCAVSDAQITFEQAPPEYTQAEIEASEGELQNIRALYQYLIVSYRADCEDDTYEVYRQIRSAAINTFKNYTLLNGYSVNPTVHDPPLPVDTTTFRFEFVWTPQRAVPPEPEEPLPF